MSGRKFLATLVTQKGNSVTRPVVISWSSCTSKAWHGAWSFTWNALHGTFFLRSSSNQT